MLGFPKPANPVFGSFSAVGLGVPKGDGEGLDSAGEVGCCPKPANAAADGFDSAGGLDPKALWPKPLPEPNALPEPKALDDEPPAPNGDGDDLVASVEDSVVAGLLCWPNPPKEKPVWVLAGFGEKAPKPRDGAVEVEPNAEGDAAGLDC